MQIFPRQLNHLPVVAAVIGLGALGSATFVFWYYFSPHNLSVGYAPKQPVLYSHRLHVGELGLDCRYCHANVERSAEAMIPPTQTCMGCHSLVKKDSERLAPIRASWASGKSMEWVRVHKVPDHAYFDHSVHLAVGVGCVSCHGRIDQMDVVRQSKPLSMGWCLECHRDPGPSLRPKDQVTNMICGITGDACQSPQDCCSGNCETSASGNQCAPLTVAQAPFIHPPQHCSGCHR